MKLSFAIAVVAVCSLCCAAPASAQKTRRQAAYDSTGKSALSGARVYVKYSLAYYPSFHTDIDHLLLYPDGTALGAIPYESLPDLHEETLRASLKSWDIGRWQKVGTTLVLTFPKETRSLRRTSRGWYDGRGEIPRDSDYDTYYPVIFPTPSKIMGTWKSESLVVMGAAGGGTPMTAAGSSQNWVFSPDGTFKDSKDSFFSSTTTNMGDGFKEDTDVTTTGSGKKKSGGTWRLEGPTLTLSRGGVKSVHLAFFMPYWTKNMANTDLMINNDRWVRLKAK